MIAQDKKPVRLIKFDDVDFLPRAEKPEMAQLGELCGESDGSELGVGFARLSGADIKWTIKYDEVITVIEGEMTVKTAEGDHHLRAKDSVWLPAGTALRYIAEDCLILYAIHPSNWAS